MTRWSPMLDKHIAKQSLTYAASAILYIAVVATIMNHASFLFAATDKSVFAPIVILTLLVVSASTMGLLIFGKPVMLYIDGKKREAVTMVTYTIGALAAFVFLLVLVVTLVRG